MDRNVYTDRIAEITEAAPEVIDAFREAVLRIAEANNFSTAHEMGLLTDAAERLAEAGVPITTIIDGALSATILIAFATGELIDDAAQGVARVIGEGRRDGAVSASVSFARPKLIELPELPTIEGVEGFFSVPASGRVSTEIIERAPTKDRPKVTYGTTTKVEIEGDIADVLFSPDVLKERVRALHATAEVALQEEIERRVAVSEMRTVLSEDV